MADALLLVLAWELQRILLRRWLVASALCAALATAAWTSPSSTSLAGLRARRSRRCATLCCTRSDVERTARVLSCHLMRCVALFCLMRLQSAARFLERYTTVLPCPARAVGGFVSLCDRLQVRARGGLRFCSGFARAWSAAAAAAAGCLLRSLPTADAARGRPPFCFVFPLSSRVCDGAARCISQQARRWPARASLRRFGCAGQATGALLRARGGGDIRRRRLGICWTGQPSGRRLRARTHRTAARCTLPALQPRPARLAAGVGRPRCRRAAAKRLTACVTSGSERHVGRDARRLARDAAPLRHAAAMPTTRCTASRRCTSTLRFLEARAGGAPCLPMLHLPPCVSRRRFTSRSWRSWTACRRTWTTSRPTHTTTTTAQ